MFGVHAQLSFVFQMFANVSKFSAGGVGGPPGGSRGAQKLRFDIFEAPLENSRQIASFPQ